MIKDAIKENLKRKLSPVIATLNKENYVIVGVAYYNKIHELINVSVGLIDSEIQNLLPAEDCKVFKFPSLEFITLHAIQNVEGAIKSLERMNFSDKKIQELKKETLRLVVDEIMLEIEKEFNL